MSEHSAGTEEDQLLAGLRRGERAAFERLVKTYGPRMLAVARRVARDEDEARDCVQEAFLQAFRRVEGFEGRASLGTWLHRIVINAALMRVRATERRSEESLDELLPQFDENGMRIDRPGPAGSSPEAAAAGHETDDLVRHAIDRLPAGYRNVLVIRDIEGYSTEETAEMLGMTPGSVKTRLHRARSALRTLLEPVLRERKP